MEKGEKREKGEIINRGERGEGRGIELMTMMMGGGRKEEGGEGLKSNFEALKL